MTAPIDQINTIEYIIMRYIQGKSRAKKTRRVYLRLIVLVAKDGIL
jgi:hypothetical protein